MLDEVDEHGDHIVGDTVLMLMNAHHQAIEFALPKHEPHEYWQPVFDTRAATVKKRWLTQGFRYQLKARSMASLATQAIPAENAGPRGEVVPRRGTNPAARRRTPVGRRFRCRCRNPRPNRNWKRKRKRKRKRKPCRNRRNPNPPLSPSWRKRNEFDQLRPGSHCPSPVPSRAFPHRAKTPRPKKRRKPTGPPPKQWRMPAPKQRAYKARRNPQTATPTAGNFINRPKNNTSPPDSPILRRNRRRPAFHRPQKHRGTRLDLDA